jgi:molybdopterin/thiamine biosynthesis adenylyltransferase
MERPRVKKVLTPVPVGDRKIRIGDFDLGLAAVLDDDEKRHTWHLLSLLDGTRTRADVISEMRRLDERLPPEDVNQAIEALIRASYLEDAAIEPPADVFSEAELSRYRRNLEFFSYFADAGVTEYDLQQRLKSAYVTVAGLGGMGSYVALALTALGVGTLHIVDSDTVELMNLNRQVLYTDADIGRAKTEAARDRLALVNPHVAVTAHTMSIEGRASARACMRDSDLFVCAVDRPVLKIYEWINQAALDERVAWIRAGNSGLTIAAFLHVPYETACFECAQRSAYEELPWFEVYNQYFIDTSGVGDVNPCNAPAAGLVGSIVALESVKYLTGMTASAVLGRRLIMDIARMTITYAAVARRDDCQYCGTMADHDRDREP